VVPIQSTELECYLCGADVQEARRHSRPPEIPAEVQAPLDWFCRLLSLEAPPDYPALPGGTRICRRCVRSDRNVNRLLTLQVEIKQLYQSLSRRGWHSKNETLSPPRQSPRKKPRTQLHQPGKDAEEKTQWQVAPSLFPGTIRLRRIQLPESPADDHATARCQFRGQTNATWQSACYPLREFGDFLKSLCSHSRVNKHQVLVKHILKIPI
jgi:hypothetical protein